MARSNSITERQAKIDAIVDCVISMAELRAEGAPDCEPKDAADHIHRRAGDIAITSDAMAAAAAALRKSPVHTAYCRQVADAIDVGKESYDVYRRADALGGTYDGDDHGWLERSCATLEQARAIYFRLLDAGSQPVIVMPDGEVWAGMH
jgi:hypothetical protein